MGLTWPEHLAATLQTAIRRHPPESNRCVELARIVLPCAREVEPQAHAFSLTPRGLRARFLLTTRSPHRIWNEHVVTFTRAHFVDALTGVAGCESEHYLSAHFQFSEYIQATPVDLSTRTGISQVDQ